MRTNAAEDAALWHKGGGSKFR